MSLEDIDALRKLMKTASPSGRGSYLEDGRHILQVKAAQCKRTNFEGKWKEAYILEFTVVQSTNPTHEVGSTRSYVENPENLGWLTRFKPALAALAGVNPYAKISQEDEETIADMIAALRYDEFRKSKQWPENFLVGRMCECEGSPGKSKNGTPITNKKWAPYEPPAGE
jgi:hypothetical protein